MIYLKNNWLTLLSVLVLVLVGAAFAGAPLVPGIQDVLAIPFATLFAQTASLVALLNLVGAAARHWAKFEGLALYSSVLIVGVVLGAVGQFAGLLTVPDFYNMPVPWGGVAFGFGAGLQAVGVNQGKRQVSGTTPVKNKPNNNLPASG